MLGLHALPRETEAYPGGEDPLGATKEKRFSTTKQLDNAAGHIRLRLFSEKAILGIQIRLQLLEEPPCVGGFENHSNQIFRVCGERGEEPQLQQKNSVSEFVQEQKCHQRNARRAEACPAARGAAAGGQLPALRRGQGHIWKDSQVPPEKSV